MPITIRPKTSLIAAVILQATCLNAFAAELSGEVAESGTASSVKHVDNTAVADKPAASEKPTDAAATQPVDFIKQGLEFMKSCDYGKALESFNAASRENPASAEPHFARARALLGLGRREEAYKEFKLCMLLDPSSRMEHKCKGEIDYANLGEHMDFSNQPRTISIGDLEKATTCITNQAENEIRRVQDDALSRSNSFRNMYNASMNGYQLSPYSAYGSYGSNPYGSYGSNGWGRYSSSRGGYVSMSSSGGRPSISSWTGTVSNVSESMRRAAALSEDARIRSEAIRDAASGLNTSMSSRPSEYSGVYLSPHNTNLFVRNYVNFEPVRPEPPEALAAKALSLDDYRKYSHNQNPGCSYLPTTARASHRYR